MKKQTTDCSLDSKKMFAGIKLASSLAEILLGGGSIQLEIQLFTCCVAVRVAYVTSMTTSFPLARVERQKFRIARFCKLE